VETGGRDWPGAQCIAVGEAGVTGRRNGLRWLAVWTGQDCKALRWLALRAVRIVWHCDHRALWTDQDRTGLR
jgi:hypothetical protein